jgi:hypothetical protein
MEAATASPEELLRAALRPAAAHMQVAAYEHGSIWKTGERRDLRPAFLNVLQPLAPVPTGEKVLELEGSKVGGVDLAIGEPPVYHGVAELKWADSPRTLGEPLWDLLKLATMLRGGKAEAAFLIVGAPVDLWERADAGTLLRIGEWQTNELFVRFRAEWEWLLVEGKWRPLRLPASGAIRLVDEVPVHSTEADWLLCLARVWSEGEDWIEMNSEGWPKSVAESVIGQESIESESTPPAGPAMEGRSRLTGSDAECMAEMLSPEEEERLVEATRSSRSRETRASPFDIFYNDALSFDQKLERLRAMLADPDHHDEAQGYVNSLARIKVLRDEGY